MKKNEKILKILHFLTFNRNEKNRTDLSERHKKSSLPEIEDCFFDGLM